MIFYLFTIIYGDLVAYLLDYMPKTAILWPNLLIYLLTYFISDFFLLIFYVIVYLFRDSLG